MSGQSSGVSCYKSLALSSMLRHLAFIASKHRILLSTFVLDTSIAMTSDRKLELDENVPWSEPAGYRSHSSPYYDESHR